MGGNAIKNAFTRRYKKDEFEKILPVIIQKAKKKFTDAKSTIYFKSKESFGDADILIEIEMPDGTTQYMKVILKVYADPSNITMKNSGMGDAGSHYLGAPEIDEELKALREKHNYLEKGISSQEFEKRKREFRVAYLTLFSQKMEELSKTPEGQEKLMEMWKEVHGCGNDVYTSVTNKKTGKTEVYPPDYYCNPKTPFKIEYDGVKVVVRMGGEDDDALLELVCKTERGGPPKLLFHHKKNKSNKNK
jgi:hypothetical protein